MILASGLPMTRRLIAIVFVLAVSAATALLQPARATDVCGVVCDVTVAAGCSLTTSKELERPEDRTVESETFITEVD